MGRCLITLAVMVIWLPAAGDPVPLEDLMRFPAFEEVKISPKGEYLAATVPDGEQTGVVILDIRDRANVRVSAGLRVNRHENATGLTWGNDDRLVFTSVRQEGPLATRYLTGNLYAINADGSRGGQIFGVRGSGLHRGASIIHRLPDEPDFILIQTFAGERDRNIAQRLHLFGQDRGAQVAVSPLLRGGVVADQQGRVRFAFGMSAGGQQQLAWRPDEGSEWQTFEHQLGAAISGAFFSEDGKSVYLLSRNSDDLGAFRVDLATGRTEKLVGDDTFEPTRFVFNRTGTEPIGATFATPQPVARFFTDEHPDARLARGLEAAFPGYTLRMGSITDDGTLGILEVSSDREPGIFLAVDIENLHVAELVAAKPWIDPERLAPKRPISFTARDGLVLHGYLSVPPGADARDLPMVVEVHGGPHGPYDQWEYNGWVQALATRGYAVLQINFRGSGGRGQQFEQGAYRQWGAQMQDDITDGTRWAIEQGIADPTRVCLSGASYGGFSTLSGLVREPDLYRCGFAFVGVYDLELMRRIGNIPSSEFGRRYLDNAIGRDRGELRARSPIHHVANIRAPLYVAHGADDHQAHFGQYHALVRALEAAKIPHETMLVPHEGHGFYRLENRVALVNAALAFFDEHIGADPD